MPKISAVMALYNTPYNYLSETVKSILNQTFTDFEFIIIDDASTIEYKSFFEELNDERIKYFKLEKNSGPGHARNEGIKKATGEYVANIDSDDVYMPERFELQINFLDKNQDIDLIGGTFRFSNKTRIEEVIEEDKQIKAFMLFNSPFANPLIMFRREKFAEKNLYYPELNNFAEDYELWIDAMFAGIKMANLTDVLMIYTRRRNQLSKLKNENQIYILKQIYKKMFSYLGINASTSDIDLHYNINLEKFDDIDSKDKIEIWFDKIIQKNKILELFDEKILIKKKETLLDKFNYSWWNYKKYILATKEPDENTIVKNNQEKTPKISAIMALYNTPYSLFEKTVSSLLSQTFCEFELIIIDDASSLEYKEFLSKFNDPRIKYFKLEKNSGPGHARNVGIRKALGEYIAIVDSDDIYMPKRFELQVEFLDKNPDIDLVSGVFQSSLSKKLSAVLEDDSEIKISMLFNSALTNAATAFRKKIFLEKNLFYPENKNFAEDYELWIDALFAGLKMANLKDVLMIYTRRKNQLSKMRMESQTLILKSLYRKIFSNLNIDFSDKEIDLHYNIYSQKFAYFTNNDISNWFGKIIEKNKVLNLFDEEKIIENKNRVLKNFNDYKNRIFKLKIGDYNFCAYKPLMFKLEKRS